MATPLETYLNDHLTGADAALDLLEQLGEEHEGELGQFFQALHDEIEGERQQLESLIERFGFGRSRLRSAGARLAEKASRFKLTGVDERGGKFHLLEALDTLQSAIQGKRGLWRALGAAATIDPDLAVLDYGGLADLASDQLNRLDAIRIQTAPAALVSSGGERGGEQDSSRD